MDQNKYSNSTCIIGIGNTLRADDGAGAYVCNLLEEKKIPATIITVQQLDVALVEELSKFNRVVFIDAAENEAGFSFQLLDTSNQQPQSSSHQVNAAMLAGLVRQLFSATTQFYICAIHASNFEMGTTLSEKTKQQANAAATMLLKWIVPGT